MLIVTRVKLGEFKINFTGGGQSQSKIIREIHEQIWERKLYKILNVVCKFYGISQGDILNESRKEETIIPRQMCHFISKALFSASGKFDGIPLGFIGNYFGGKNHATVLNSYDKILYYHNTPKLTTKKGRKPYNELMYFMNKFNLWGAKTGIYKP